MEFLQQFFGNLSSGLIRLGVAVGILAAVGYFIVRPILQTTENTVENTNHTIEKSFESSHFDVKALQEEINKTVEGVNNQVQTQVEHSFHAAKVHPHGNVKAEKLIACIQRAHQNVHRIERCSKKFS